MGQGVIEFTAYVHPEPQGSMRAFTPKGWKRPVLTSDNKDLKSFRQEVAAAAIKALAGTELPAPEGMPVRFRAEFFFAKPKSTPKRVLEKTTRPDLSKLLRATEDALTGIVWKDDAQIYECLCAKRFGLPERVEVKIAIEPDRTRRIEKLG